MRIHFDQLAYRSVIGALACFVSACSTPQQPSDGGDASTNDVASDIVVTDAQSDGGNSIPTDTAALVRACSVLTACTNSVALRTASCVQLLRFYADSALAGVAATAVDSIARDVQCALSATDCRSYQFCATLGHGPLYCEQHTGESCDENVSVSCASGTPDWARTVTDCARLGLQCRVGAGNAVCTTGRTCSGSASSCDGPRRLGCSSGFETSTDCSRWPGGGTCSVQSVDGGAAIARCVPTAGGRPACNAPVSPHCVGNVLHACIEYGLPELELDCAAGGGRCEAGDGGGASCVPIVNECTDGTPDRCEGSTLVTCVDGQWRRIPCATVWKSQCVLSSSIAHCAD